MIVDEFLSSIDNNRKENEEQIEQQKSKKQKKLTPKFDF